MRYTWNGKFFFFTYSLLTHGATWKCSNVNKVWKFKVCSSSPFGIYVYGSFIRFMYTNTPNILLVCYYMSSYKLNMKCKNNQFMRTGELTRDLFEIIFFDWINFWLVKLGNVFWFVHCFAFNFIVIARGADQYIFDVNGRCGILMWMQNITFESPRAILQQNYYFSENSIATWKIRGFDGHTDFLSVIVFFLLWLITIEKRERVNHIHCGLFSISMTKLQRTRCFAYLEFIWNELSRNISKLAKGIWDFKISFNRKLRSDSRCSLSLSYKK